MFMLKRISMIAVDYTLLRATAANVGAALVVTAIVRMVIFEGPMAEAMYLLVGGFCVVLFTLIRRAENE